MSKLCDVQKNEKNIKSHWNEFSAQKEINFLEKKIVENFL